MLPVLCLSVCCATACKTKGEEYFVYTNLPSGEYTVTDNSFKFEYIEGLELQKEEFESEDLSAYTTKGWMHSGIVDAELKVSDDFTKDGAETKFSSFRVDVRQLLDDIDKAVSTSVANSDITRFNEAEAGAKIEIGQVGYEILCLSYDAYTFTEGYYNPALYYNVLAYGFGTAFDYPKDASKLPKDEIIEKYTDLASHFGELKLTESDGKYFVEKPAYSVQIDGEEVTMRLDLGGISKGYAVDKIEELFESYDYDYGMFSYGASSILVRGNIREGNYRIGLINPRSFKRDSFIEIPARNKKLSTSGDNEQFYRINGVRYCHIIDPATGKPVQQGIMSATIIGGSAAEDDALTTAIMCMGKEKASKFIEEKLTDRIVVFTTT